MKSRINREDFMESSKWRVGLDELSESCWVCNEYEFEEMPGEDKLGVPRYKFYPAHTDSEVGWRQYWPLEAYPDLFRRFTNLYDQEWSKETVRNWVEQYGLLGVGFSEDWDAREEGGELQGIAEEEEKDGRPRETTEQFFREVRRATAIRRAYEAWLDQDSRAAERVTRQEFVEFTEQYWDVYRESGEIRKRHGGYLGFAHTFAAFESEWATYWHVHPRTVMDLDNHSESRALHYWSLDGPLGAIYLRIYWLIRAGRITRRCASCGYPILSDSPPPGYKDKERRQRSLRWDRKYCSDACRQRYGRHNRKKP